MRRTFVWSLSAFLAISLLAGLAMSAPSTISYQGRLTNSSGTPVADGSYSVSFSLWTDSVGGSMIWSESQTIQVTGGGGLFSTQLGSLQPLGGPLVIHGGEDLFLQTAVSGTALVPRLAIGAVPHAFASSSMSSIVPGIGSMQMSVGDDTTKITTSHTSFTNLLDSYLNLTDDKGLLGLKCYGAGQPHPQSSCNSEVGDDRATNFLDFDDDADGIPDVVEGMSVRPGTASLGVSSSKRRFNLMDAFPQRFRVSAHDSDTGSSVTMALESDLNLDGSAESSISQSTDSSGATQSLNKKGINAVNVKLAVTGSIEGDEARHSLTEDGDDDGFPDQEVTSRVIPTKAQHAINTKGTGAQAGRAVSITSETTVDSAKQVFSVDDDGDGNSEARANIAVILNGNVVIGCATDGNDDGTEDGEAAMIVTPTTSSVAIKEKGTGADPRRTSIMSTAGLDSAGVLCDNDSDGDGLSESRVSIWASAGSLVRAQSELGLMNTESRLHSAPDSASVYCGADSDGDGIPEDYISNRVKSSESKVIICHSTASSSNAFGMTVSPDSTDLSLTQSNSDGESSMSAKGNNIRKDIQVKVRRHDSASSRETTISADTASTGMQLVSDANNDGINENDASLVVTPTSSTVQVGASAKNIGLYVKNTGGCDLVMTDASLGTVDTTIVIDGALKRFGIGISQPDYPLHHSSGAHLTVGGVWTNASDENLKENFQPVDGAELLEKIDQLPISEWNYKTESDEVKHIGPTAQDFQRVFSVGENDKTISTIDPSGIALAAIKELNKKLERENKELRAEMDELKKLLQELATKK